MKKISLFLLLALFIKANSLDFMLNSNYKELYDIELEQSLRQKNYDSKAWISPIIIEYKKNLYDKNKDLKHTGTLTITYEQPIFKWGGIINSIKLAKVNYKINKLSIYKDKTSTINSVARYLLQYKITKLEIEKVKLKLKNNNINIKDLKELFNMGMIDSLVLDNEISDKNKNEVDLLNLKQRLNLLKNGFKKISSLNINRAKLPNLKVISKQEYLNKNLDIKISKLQISSSKYRKKLTVAKYLPQISLGAEYKRNFNIDETKYIKSSKNIYLKASLPISVNSKDDIEIAKLKTMISAINHKITKDNESLKYDVVINNIKAIQKQINLTNKDIKLYKSLLAKTKVLYNFGQKRKKDLDVLKNIYKIKKLDKKILILNKKLEVLKLYENI